MTVDQRNIEISEQSRLIDDLEEKISAIPDGKYEVKIADQATSIKVFSTDTGFKSVSFYELQDVFPDTSDGFKSVKNSMVMHIAFVPKHMGPSREGRTMHPDKICINMGIQLEDKVILQRGSHVTLTPKDKAVIELTNDLLVDLKAEANKPKKGKVDDELKGIRAALNAVLNTNGRA